MARKTRRLSEDNKAVWEKTASTVTPMEKAPGLALPKAPRKRAEPKAKPTEPIKPFRLGQAAESQGSYLDAVPSLSDQFASAPVEMDRKAFQKLRRGKAEPEARIDLHGMTLAQAHPALTRFIGRANGNGLRLVLVITGKGKMKDRGGPIPERHGALRHQVPEWLKAMGGMVLQITPAHPKHGGTGAYYVYLRRRR